MRKFVVNCVKLIPVSEQFIYHVVAESEMDAIDIGYCYISEPDPSNPDLEPGSELVESMKLTKEQAASIFRNNSVMLREEPSYAWDGFVSNIFPLEKEA